MRRSVLAALVLVGWSVVAAVYSWREVRKAAEKRTSDLRSRLVPGSQWFLVERQGQQCGYASLEVDTLPLGQARLRWRLAHGCLDRLWEEEWLARTTGSLAPRSLDWRHVLGSDTLRGSVRAAGKDPHLLEGTLRSSRKAERSPLLLGDSVAPRQLLLLGLALRGNLREGDERGAALLAPDGSVVLARYLVKSDSLLIVADSAAWDTRGQWLAARSDTVRAWYVLERGNQSELALWVDASGQIVLAHLDSGLVVRRTAFELAFENWRLARSTGRGAGSTATPAAIQKTR